MPLSEQILLINAGSSSVRLALALRASGAVQSEERHELRDPHPPEMTAILERFLTPRRDGEADAPGAIGHRIVHGGAVRDSCVRITPEVEAEVERACEIAPLHNPVALAWYRSSRTMFPAATHAALFDTGYFSELPEVAREYAIPRAERERLRARRYGFHGFAHEDMVECARKASGAGRVISLQLGSGCSVAASREGRAIDTSMGYSPVEGLIMSSRCGDIDAGLVLALCESTKRSIASVREMLNKESGLLALSELSVDMRTLLASKDPKAANAVDAFCYRARKYVGAYAAALGGIDAIVFGGGIGEGSPLIRERIVGGLEWLGIRLDRTLNESPEPPPEPRLKPSPERVRTISTAKSSVSVYVCAVDEASLMLEKLRSLL